jgi:dienelactone hydrolase
LNAPPDARGIVVFAHGSGSGRHSPRNRYVAAELRSAGLATLLMDLLSVEEESADELTGDYRFDIELLAGRLTAAARWLRERSETSALAIGYFGASTGAGAALVSAAARPDLVSAVVSRGGRPDLAGRALSRVQAPTLLIVGGNDDVVIDEPEALPASREKAAHRPAPRIRGAGHAGGGGGRATGSWGTWLSRHYRCARPDSGRTIASARRGPRLATSIGSGEAAGRRRCR